jgi:hypothetical protein
LQCATGFDCGSRLESSRKTPIGKVNHAVTMPQVAQAAAGCKQSVNIHEFGKAQQVYKVLHISRYNFCANTMIPNQNKILVKMHLTGLDRSSFAVIFIHLCIKNSWLL